jgi:hypothetical protein
MPRSARFKGVHRFWVDQAKPPEDYIYENLSVSKPKKLLRLMLSRWAAAS